MKRKIKETAMLIGAIVLFFSGSAEAQNSGCYQLKLATINSTQISLSSFSGKKILIAVFDAASPDTGFLKGLDSINLKYKNSIGIIAVPASDLSAAVTDDNW